MFSASIFGPRPRMALFRVGIILVIVFIISRFILSPTFIVGNSMAPTYSHGDINVINHLAYRKSEPARGDVVAVRWEKELLVKRIVGVPGEEVGFFYGIRILDGKPAPESYVKMDSGWMLMPPIKLGPDEYLVIGDNRGMSMEDHTFGVVKREQIIGRMLL
jgi:signal peptidase I